MMEDHRVEAGRIPAFLGKLLSDFGHGIPDLRGQGLKFFTQFFPYSVPERLHRLGPVRLPPLSA